MEFNQLFMIISCAVFAVILLIFFGMTLSIHFSNRTTINTLQEQLETSKTLVESWHRKELRQIKLQLWEKRLDVFFACENVMLTALDPKGKPMELLRRNELDRKIRYLFGPEVRAYTQEIFDNCDEYYVKRHKKVSSLEHDPQYIKLTRYFKRQLQEGLNEVFYPYINFNEQLR